MEGGVWTEQAVPTIVVSQVTFFITHNMQQCSHVEEMPFDMSAEQITIHLYWKHANAKSFSSVRLYNTKAP